MRAKQDIVKLVDSMQQRLNNPAIQKIKNTLKLREKIQEESAKLEAEKVEQFRQD
jgi:hypothetical protein